MEKFTKLGLSKELTDVLKESGFTEPSEIQEKAIPIVLAGKDIIGGSATGSGKTLAFASAIIENLKPNGNVQALVLTPTRELAEQVATSIRKFGANKKLNVLAVYGGVNIMPQIKKLSTTDVLVGTPGRIMDHLGRRSLNLKNVKFLVLDEVDRMLDMGFIKDVEQIIHECPKNRQTMMFSATISSDLDHLAKKYAKNPVEISVESHVDPSKLKQIYYDVQDNKKFSLLVNLLKNESSDLVMVFCNTRRNVDLIADNLIQAGIPAKAIHGRIDQAKRIRVLEEFHKKGFGVLVCTDVAARGLDIKGVSHVYNYEVPNEAKDYIHRIGRTARAGEDGKAITVLASRDYENFRNLMGSEGIKIAPEKLPHFETVRVSFNSGREGNRFGRVGRNNFDGPRRRSGFNMKGSGPRSGSNFNRGPRRDAGGSRGRFGPRRNESGDSKGSSRDGGRDSRGGRSFGRRTMGSERKDVRSGGKGSGRIFGRGPSRDSRGPKRDDGGSRGRSNRRSGFGNSKSRRRF